MKTQKVLNRSVVIFSALLYSPLVSASILYSGPTNLQIGGTFAREHSIDVNGDGINDFTIFSDADDFGGAIFLNSEIYPLNAAGGIASIKSSFYVTRFEKDTVIGGGLFFAHAPEANIGPGDLAPPHEGNFVNMRGYLGLKVVSAEATNYGWMDIAGTFGPLNTAYEITVYGWAIQTDQSTPILAGDTGMAIPALRIDRGGTNIQIQWLSEPGKTYQLMTSANFVTWQNAGNSIPGDGTGKIFVDSIESSEQRFYRISVQ